MLRSTAALSIFATACSAQPPHKPIEKFAASSSRGVDELRALAPQARWHYDVELAAGQLHVEALLADCEGTRFGADRQASAYIRDVALMRDNAWRAIDGEGSFTLPDCHSGCRLRYRYELLEAAVAIDNDQLASTWGETIFSPPSAWLLRPNDDTSFVFRVHGDRSFVTGVTPDPEVAGVYGGESGYLWRSPYSAFGAFDQKRFDIGGGIIDVAVARPHDIVIDDVHAWIEDSATTVAGYFGRFPVKRVLVIVRQGGGDSIHGKEMGGGGTSIVLSVGPDARADRFDRDWIAVHEMIHLAVPSMPRKHQWLTEGLATYVEPIARARRARISEREVWWDMLKMMHNGLPEEDDRGIDNTPTWGRTYWGGALFWFIADLEIRKATSNDKSLSDAMSAVTAAHGDNSVAWPIERYFDVCDKATGTTVLRDLYAAWKDNPVTVDLDGLWRDLGVSRRGRRIIFDDEAPLADIRRGITSVHSASR